MASASVGMIGGSWVNGVGERKKQKRNSNSEGRVRISCACSSSSSSSSVVDPYKTLRIKPGASESEVKKAFRRLALQYHPDVCKESNGRVQFQAIYEAYDMLMDRLKDEGPLREEEEEGYYDQGIYEPMRGRNDPDYDLWEEWMGWEGAGIRDYSSHINPYI